MASSRPGRPSTPRSLLRKTRKERREEITAILTSIVGLWTKDPGLIADYFSLTETICQNIITHPKVATTVSIFRKIDSRRSLFRSTIGKIKGGPQLLVALGFRLDEDLYYNYDFIDLELLKNTAAKIFEIQRKIKAKNDTHVPVYKPPLNRIRTMPLPPTPVIEPAVNRQIDELFTRDISESHLDPRARAFEILETIEARIMRFHRNYLLSREQSSVHVVSEGDELDNKHQPERKKQVTFELPAVSFDSLERVISSLRVIREDNTLLKEKEQMKDAHRRAKEEKKKQEEAERKRKERTSKEEEKRLAKLRKEWEEARRIDQEAKAIEKKKKNQELRKRQEEDRRKRAHLEKRFSKGDEVIVHSLREATYLNGLQGKVTGPLRRDYRWPVRVMTRDGKRQPFNFLDSNLRPKTYNLNNREMDCMAKLMGMGFSVKDSRNAAMRANGNMKKALQYISGS